MPENLFCVVSAVSPWRSKTSVVGDPTSAGAHPRRTFWADRAPLARVTPGAVAVELPRPGPSGTDVGWLGTAARAAGAAAVAAGKTLPRLPEPRSPRVASSKAMLASRSAAPFCALGTHRYVTWSGG